ncbi:hypothetical protein BO99DRAFT_444004 [Aspergillus violaceofuscus CBS 115571]|uniref:rRNA-processing protein EFG1 n=1 Tax=Aspergillus violaceofuscus (strain CBS 115571) TaxID=1450538 RepID=A0A2V5H3Y2_ASPV1|nr:hypothetical protein BO99DRAFT_444004 [Aspergillus violaceofuscus CBS 115571]
MPREYQPRPSKRKHSDNGGGGDDLEERGHGHHSRKKVFLKKNPDFTSVNDLKKRIRAAKRLLAKPDLPADVRVTQERALLGYERDLEEEMQSRERSKLIKKYHFVRFLERKTATKEIARLTHKEKELTENTPDMDAATREKKLASVAKKLHVARVNLNYTIYYPLTEKYIALYADVKKNKKAEGGQGDVEAEQDQDQEDAAGAAEKSSAMWKTVEQCMKDGTLDLLRDGKLNNKERKAKSTDTGAAADKSTKSKKSAREHPDAHKSSARAKGDDRKQNKKKSHAKQDDYEMPDAGNNDDGNESDGGFFEM